MNVEVMAGCDFGSFSERTSQGSFPQFKGRLHLGRFGLPHPWHRAEFFDSALRKSAHTPKSIQNIHSDLHGRRPMTTDPKKNGKKLSVGERLWPLRQEAFTRPLCFGPLSDAVHSILTGHSSSILSVPKNDTLHVFVLVIQPSVPTC